jgi:predicted nucleotidyltransferase
MAIEIDADNEEIQRIAPVLTSLRAACRDLGVAFFVIGALARDLHLQHLNDIDVPRRTRDVDVAVGVDGWDSYAALRDRLITGYDFTDEDPKQKVRSPDGVELDLVPFGGIEDSSGQIHFPPDDRPEMTVLGLEEARRTTVSVTFDDGGSVEVVSLPALGLLKLIAWDERPRERAHDAQDLCFILRQYFDVGLDAIVERHADLFDADEFNRPLVSARAYGREIASLLQEREALRKHVFRILERETADVHQSSLADAMNAAGCHPEYDLRFDSITALLTGIKEELGE